MKLHQHSVMRLGLSGALLALGSLAAVSCGDDDSSPPDARRPADASQAEDANRPPDANRPSDGGTTDGGGTDGSVSAGCDDLDDSREPNDSAEAAPVVDPMSTGMNPDWIYGNWTVQACLGNGNEDWYRIDASQLRWDLSEEFDGTATIRLRTIISGTGACADNTGCNDVRLPDGPENTVTVSVYRASDKELLATSEDTHGVLKLNGRNPSFDEDLLVQVSGPAAALYQYRLTIFIDVTGSEDECEC
jgi:hypothetical protein